MPRHHSDKPIIIYTKSQDVVVGDVMLGWRGKIESVSMILSIKSFCDEIGEGFKFKFLTNQNKIRSLYFSKNTTLVLAKDQTEEVLKTYE